MTPGLDAYIPIDRRYALARSISLPDRAGGSVLFADISGFSTIASVLEQALGPRQGADELMLQVNRLYTALINQVHRYGGSVITFSGDSVTCWFDEKLPDPQGEPGNSAHRATACALAMQEVMGRFSDHGPIAGAKAKFSWSIKVSVVTGTARRFLVGLPRIQTIDVLAGGLLDRSAVAEHLLQPGQVIVGSEVLGHFGPSLQVSSWLQGPQGEHFALVSGISKAVSPVPWPEIPVLDPVRAGDWLLPPVYQRLQRGEGEFLAELRPTVAIFLQFSGINYDTDEAAGEKLNSFVSWVQTVFEQYGGYLLQISVGDKGSYGLASIGTTVSHADDTMRAVAAAHALMSPSPDLNYILDLRVGISWGTMLVGAYGSEIRRMFSIQGSETNIAARLMEKAEAGQILVTNQVAEAAQQMFELHDLGLFELKGLVKPLPVFAVAGRKLEQEAMPKLEAPIVGRAAELAVFKNRLQAIGEGRSGSMVVEGEAGIGKSRLVTAFFEEAQKSGKHARRGSGDAIERATPFHAWRPIFRDIFQLGMVESQANVQERIVDLLANRQDADDLADLLGGALGLCRVEDGWGSYPFAAGRVDFIREHLLEILTLTFTNNGGQVLIFDDAQWIDSASWSLLADLRRSFAPLITVIATRPMMENTLIPKEYKTILAAPETVILRLPKLAPEESTAMVAQSLGVSDLPDEVSKFILRRAEGHPFFSEEIAHALIDAGILRIKGDESTLVTQNGDLDELDFPVTVQGVIISRIDRLDAPTQLTLKVASVIGPSFSFENLYDVHPIPGDKENLHDHLAGLSRLDIIEADMSDPGASYIFKHRLIQEIAYSRLLISQKQQLHQAVAEWLENNHRANTAPYYPLLAYHWGKAAEARTGASQDHLLVTKALYYLEKSGEQSLQNSAYREAINFFNEALSIAADRDIEVEPERQAQWSQYLGEAYHQWGQWSEARDKLAEAAALYGRPIPGSQAGVIGGIFGQILKQFRNRLWPSRFVGTAPESQRQTILKVAHIYQSLSELSYLTNETAFSFYAVLYALNLSEYGGLSPELVRAYSDIGVIVGLFGPRRMAEGYGERARQTALALGDPAATVSAKLGLSLYLLDAGQLDKAQENLEDALKISETLGNRRLWGDNLGILARTIYFRGGLDQSADLYAELGGPRSGVMMHRVWALNSQALFALRKGDLDLTLSFLNKALSLPGESPEPQQEIVTWAYLGTAYLRLGDRQRAREATAKSVSLMEASKASAYTLFEPMAAVADVYLSLWELQGDRNGGSSEEYAAAAHKLCKSLGRQTTQLGRPSALLYQGWYDWLAGNEKRAFKRWAKGLEAARKTGMPFEQGRLHLEIGRHLPDTDPARRENLLQACAIFEQIGALFQLQRASEILDGA